jgi:hypothetical protein
MQQQHGSSPSKKDKKVTSHIKFLLRKENSLFLLFFNTNRCSMNDDKQEVKVIGKGSIKRKKDLTIDISNY